MGMAGTCFWLEKYEKGVEAATEMPEHHGDAKDAVLPFEPIMQNFDISCKTY